jgi:hypothetical protein
MGSRQNGGHAPRRSQSSAELEQLLGSGETPDINVVTGLVQSLMTSVQKNQEARDRVGNMASKILEVESERTRLLQEYIGDSSENVDVSMENNQPQRHDQDGKSTNLENSHVTVYGDRISTEEPSENDLYQENLALKIELQRLEEYDTKATQLIGQYEVALTHLRVDARCSATEYEIAKKQLINSYKARLDEEQRTYDEFKAGHDRLLFALKGLNESLKDARNNLPQNTN